MTWDINFDYAPIKISNFFSYKDEYKQILSTNNKVEYEGQKVDTYISQKIKPRFTWDMRATYDWKMNPDYHTIFGFTINNLTDRNNLYASDSKLYSEIGRQFIADVTFKF